jgi:uncharacterized protein YdaU (DUF1376 family)
MSKEKAPAYQRYPADYLSDIKVQAMTLEEEGMYNRLLEYCWREIELPGDPEILASLCKGKRPTPLVLSCFIALRSQSDDSAMVLRHKRHDEERKNQENNRARRSLAGQKGNIGRWGKPKKVKKIIANGSQTDVPSTTLAIANDRSSSSSSTSSSNTNTHTKAARRAPEDFQVTEKMRLWAKTEKLDADLDAETRLFMDHEYEKPKSDWPAAWRNWIRNAPKFKMLNIGGKNNGISATGNTRRDDGSPKFEPDELPEYARK